MVSDKKIAIVGLDNAGKTSILTAIRQKFDIEKQVRNLPATKLIERTGFQFMNHTFSNWDFGGQKKYREEYLAHKDRFLSGIDLLYFVFDVQDSLRFDESLEYFGDILKYLKEQKNPVPAVVIFHKVDPSFAEDPTIINNILTLKEKMQPLLDFTKFRFFDTTIFDLQSVIRAFSAGIRLMYSQSEAIEKFLLDLVDKLQNVMALLIFEQSGISLGEYYLEHITLQAKKKILTMFEVAQKRIAARNMNSFEFSDRIDSWTKVSGLIQSFNIDDVVFYIMLIVQEKDELEQIIDEFNYFERSYPDIKTILSSLLEDEPEQQKMLNPENHTKKD